MKKILAVFTVLILCVSLFVACGKKTITAEKAQEIALDHAGLKKSQVSDIHTHIIEQEGVPCIQIHMTTESGEITVVINASTGEVIGNG